jgi:hypothetical protein
MPGVSGVTVVTMLVCSFYFAREAAGASSARHSLRPLIFGGERFMHDSGALRRENARLRLDVIARSTCDEAIHASWLAHGLLRGACHRAALGADPLARNDGFKFRLLWLFEN